VPVVAGGAETGWRRVLSIGKLGHGQESYYLETVAHGVEDYYLGHGEAPGRWLGAGATTLGLAGQLDAETLRAVLEGRDPGSGDRLVRGRSDRVPGFDLTFRAPKSVSVLFGLGDPETAGAVRAGHDASVDAALGYLERAACWSRRGTNGIVTISGDGFVGAAFRHRTSRAGDPHLHTHVLVANLTRGTDSQWATLDARHLYLHAKTAGYLYEAHLRAELTQRVGVAWGPVRNGIADIDGIPETVLRVFSTRRAEIEAEMAGRGVSSARAAEIAAFDTRQAKDYAVDPVAMVDQWWETAHALGFDPETLAAVLDRDRPVPLTEPHVTQLVNHLLGEGGLTEQASTFDRRAVLRAWCDQITNGAEVQAIEGFADRTLTEPAVVALRSGSSASLYTRGNSRRIQGPALGVRYSTAELIAFEQDLVDHAVARQDGDAGTCDEETVLAALRARPELSDEQVAMVVQLTTSGHGIEVVIAAAGTGKTFALDAARDAWQRAGHPVIGAALAARAAAELEASAGIRSQTIASLLVDLDDPEHGRLPAESVLVVDEAGMVGTRTLARLIDHAAYARAKVVLVGDPRQLPEIDAGGLLRGLGTRLSPIRLTQNRRQHDPWERAALSELRAGHIDTALAAYHQHDRIVTGPTAPGVRDAMVADWWAAHLRGDRVLMLAGRWSDAEDLNARARRRVHAAGQLSGPVLALDGRPYQAGDRIMTLRNQRRLGVRNGTLATITHIDPDQRAVTIRTDTQTSHALPAAYLDAGHLRHAYATTIHKAQGLTCDQALVLGNDTLYQEAGYVALSRGRAQNRLYLVAQPDEPEAHAPEPIAEPLDTLAAALKISHAQQLAVDHGIDRRALHHELDQLHDQLCGLQRVERAAPPDASRDVAALRSSRTELERDLDRQREHLDELEARRPLRHRREHIAQRLLATQHVEQLTEWLDQTDHARATALDQQARHDTYTDEHRAELARIPAIESTIRMRLDQLVASYRSNPPTYLAPLGPVPNDRDGRAHWTDAARGIEDYRHRHHITDPDHPFGPAERNSHHQQHAQETLDQALEHLAPERGAIQDLGLEL
jgi:conjugative relaxase-like TrwC/TraI family protein